MEELRRFDVAQYGDVRMVVVESDLLPPDPAIVVIPLLRDYPAIPHLNPQVTVEGETFVLATRLIGAVRRPALRRVGSLAGQTERITRALDVLTGGF